MLGWLLDVACVLHLLPGGLGNSSNPVKQRMAPAKQLLRTAILVQTSAKQSHVCHIFVWTHLASVAGGSSLPKAMFIHENQSQVTPFTWDIHANF